MSNRQFPTDAPDPREPGERHNQEPHDDDVGTQRDGGPSEPVTLPTPPAHPTRRRRTRVDPQTGMVHLTFGAVEELLADLTPHGAPDGGVVRVERLVRTKADTMGGTATLGIAVTARREDEVLSAWLIVGRLALDPWGRPLDRERARRAAERHRDAQHLVGALFADAGFDIRLGLYLLPEACYGFAATCATLDALDARDAAEPGHPTQERGEASGPGEARDKPEEHEGQGGRDGDADA